MNQPSRVTNVHSRMLHKMVNFIKCARKSMMLIHVLIRLLFLWFDIIDFDALFDVNGIVSGSALKMMPYIIGPNDMSAEFIAIFRVYDC